MAVLVVVALAALGVLAGTASANTGAASGVTCTSSIGGGQVTASCTKDGKTLACTARFSWPAGLTISCTLPDGTVKQVWPRP
jgi:hypothetical protein